jgi:2-hydroxychromene-2-carboxylate isomerase
VARLFAHVWCRDGADPHEPAALAALAEAVAPQRSPAGAEVKAELRARTEAALAAGIFGVPTLVCEGRAFFGLDALPMLRQALLGEPGFDAGAWQAAGEQPPGVQR